MDRKAKLDPEMLAFTRTLRARATDAERQLWFRLRARRVAHCKFRRQHPLPPYVLDFYCEQHKLAIELDGSQHATVNDSSSRRAAFLAGHGIRVLRFWDNKVLRDIDAVLEAIRLAVEDPVRAESSLTPTPLPVGEGS
ncbi:endonuclease domain-containing protein [Permianibacter sp. IMCC34836]|uniref:endonuclease domain-containing protein n=1 Tax=Permianibacter fluminis TaxID=2738515 RepID=UPI001551FA92|nr:DUF559 domain-containing protein [Permianibacter fluminis]NQD36254.1 endonuclease domain-containing protein [Permianibacter fluminis]